MEPKSNPHPLEYHEMPASQLEELATFGRPETYGPLHDMSLQEWEDAQRLAQIRNELRDYPPGVYLSGDEDIEPIRLPTLQVMEGGETGMLQEKKAKRSAAAQKERSPRRYDEKLLVISDLQLLHETNEEGVGALLKYIKDQGHTFTTVILNGDIIDFAQQSGFRKDNQLGDSVTQDEQVAGRWFIDFVGRHCPSANKVFLKGNHEARYDNMYLDTNNGVQQYLKPFEEVFGLQDWTVLGYGQGVSFEVHGRKFRHGTKGGIVQNIPKIEMDRNWRATTVGHAITNRMWEFVDADGNSFISFVHAGFSKTAMYDRTGDKKPSNGFGVYYYAKVGREWVETPYQVIFSTTTNTFISPEGNVYSGKGFDLRQEIGLDPRGRGRPRKQL